MDVTIAQRVLSLAFGLPYVRSYALARPHRSSRPPNKWHKLPPRLHADGVYPKPRYYKLYKGLTQGGRLKDESTELSAPYIPVWHPNQAACTLHTRMPCAA